MGIPTTHEYNTYFNLLFVLMSSATVSKLKITLKLR